MQIRIMSFAALASLLAASVAGPALAAYTGLTVSLHNSVTIDGIDRDVYRVYANFSNPGDRLAALFGAASMSSLMTVESRNSDDSGPGGAFYNFPGGMTAPSAAMIAFDPDAEWDTFGTIGLARTNLSPYGDMTTLAPGFTGIQDGTSTTISNGAWYCAPTFDHDGDVLTPQIAPPQTLAGWTGDGDAALRVLVLQLTVNSGDNVRGVINIAALPPIGQGGGYLVSHQSFNSYLAPGPSAIALLGVAGVFMRRRSRGA